MDFIDASVYYQQIIKRSIKILMANFTTFEKFDDHFSMAAGEQIGNSMNSLKVLMKFKNKCFQKDRQFY
jgi:hypothetical protein